VSGLDVVEGIADTIEASPELVVEKIFGGGTHGSFVDYNVHLGVHGSGRVGSTHGFSLGHE
jgi:hypothetical protein